MQSNNQLVQFDKLKAEISVKFAPTLEIKVTEDESKNKALLAGKEVKHYAKLVEEKRKELVKPLNDEVDKINAYAKSILEPLKKSETHLKSELISYENILEKKRIEEYKRIEAEKKAALAKAEEEAKKARDLQAFNNSFGSSDEDAIKKDIELEVAEERRLSEIEKHTKSEIKAASKVAVSGARKVWNYKLTDIYKVPVQFLEINTALIRAEMNKQVKEGKTPVVSGIEFFQETTMALR